MIRTILVVDERERYRAPIRAVLEEEGYHVYEATSGDEGLELTWRLRPDLVIVEETLHLTSGMTMVEVLRLSPRAAGLPTLTLPSSTSRMLVGARSDSSTAIRQPLRPREVLEAVVQRIGGAVA